MINGELTKIFSELSMFETIENGENSNFKARAYQKAAENINSLPEDISIIYSRGGKNELMKIPGIGKAIADKIEEYINTGKIEKYENFKEKYPVNFSELTRIEGIGAKTALMLYKELGIKDVNDLKAALDRNELNNIPNFGPGKEKELRKGIEKFQGLSERMLISDAYNIANEIVNNLLKSGFIEKIEIVGSLRRMKETIGDIDILATGSKKDEIMNVFIKMDNVSGIVVNGASKSTVYLKEGTTCDLRIIDKDSFGAAMQYFTGSRDHNIKLRTIAINRNMKLNEYGLYSGDKMVYSEIENDIYKGLGLDYIEPELRENRGEIEAAGNKSLPDLIKYDSLKGDLHTHTVETDGVNTIEEMAKAAIDYGLKYIATTNHTKSLNVAHGMDENAFRKFFKNVDIINERYGKKFTILKGAEVDILKDGSLDLDNSILNEMDCVVASVHSGFNMEINEMTSRIVNALNSGKVNILGHPTGRILNRRAPYEINIDKIAQSAEDNHVALEINSSPERLDLKDTDIIETSKYKINYAINSDAHSINHFSNLRFGLGTARRGWLQESRVINTMDIESLLKILKR